MAMLMKYKLFLIFGLLMVVEGAGLFFFLGQSKPATPAHEEALVKEAHAESDFVEFELGDYKISNNSVEGSPMRIDCKIFAEVPKEYEHHFTEAYELKKHRVRDAVQAIVRGASYADVTDPDLGAIKRKLKKAIMDVIGSEKPYIAQVIVSDFQSYQL
ncbi:flagellar basal body-associated FliL family protein [bacterium]|jgi:hypothetical protein|nr:flagellar basal body-associated FliL family protein [bacterium]